MKLTRQWIFETCIGAIVLLVLAALAFHVIRALWVTA